MKRVKEREEGEITGHGEVRQVRGVGVGVRVGGD
jgi:hypothetical protein